MGRATTVHRAHMGTYLINCEAMDFGPTELGELSRRGPFQIFSFPLVETG